MLFHISRPHLYPIKRRAHLYVGNLSPRVTEYMLTEIFAVAGPVSSVKIIPDRNYQHGGLNYGFVEYIDMRAAETALQTLNGRKIFDTEIRVNWAYQGTQNKEDTAGHFHVFVGDLSPEVNDAVLQKAFSAFGSMSDARVMWDMGSGKSRGYGFLSFRDKTDAEQAIATMNGEWLGSRAIRVNWANQKTQGAPGGSGGGYGGPGMGGMGGMPMGMSMQPPMPPSMGMGMPMAGGYGGGASMIPAPMSFQGGPLSYDTVLAQSTPFNTTVYVGNLVPFATQTDLIPLFQSIGYVSEIRIQADRGFAFVKLDTHENAAMAIVQLQGQMVHGRPIKCSWGKDRASEAPGTAAVPQQAYGAMVSSSRPPNVELFLTGIFVPARSVLHAPGRCVSWLRIPRLRGRRNGSRRDWSNRSHAICRSYRIRLSWWISSWLGCSDGPDHGCCAASVLSAILE